MVNHGHAGHSGHQGHVEQPFDGLPPPSMMTRDIIVREIVIAVRTMDHKSKLRSDQCRNLRQQAERLADRIVAMDDVTQRIVVGLCSQRGIIADGAMLDQFVDEAKLVSEALSSAPPPWRDGYNRDLGERPPRMLEIIKELVVRTRVQMDARTRMAQISCKALRDRAEQLAQQILDLDHDTQEVVIGFCVHGGMADGSHLQSYVDQARLLVQALNEEYPPPMAQPTRR